MSVGDDPRLDTTGPCGRRTGSKEGSSEERLGRPWLSLSWLLNPVTREPREGVNDSWAVGGYADRGGERGTGDIFVAPFICGSEGALPEGSWARMVGELGVDLALYLLPLLCCRLISAMTLARWFAGMHHFMPLPGSSLLRGIFWNWS